jgi:hyperosmotically inducible periplasmic protein
MKYLGLLSLASMLVLSANPALADNSAELSEKINSCEKSGAITREAAVQFRADADKIAQDEKDIRAKHDGLLPAQDGVKLTKSRKKLIDKIAKLETKKPDNTAHNKGDDRKESPTPQVQGTSKSDLDKVVSIRRQLSNDKSLSINAKNAKIIVINGTVTLRGVVNSPDEKAKVVAAAKSFADDSKILDELEVKTK